MLSYITWCIEFSISYLYNKLYYLNNFAITLKLLIIQRFYVGAPNALNNNPTGRAEFGAVYKCTKDGRVRCIRSLIPPFVDSLNNSFPIRPLFGQKFSEGDQNTLLICAPNMVYVKESRSYCMKLDRETGLKVNNGDFPLYRIEGSQYILDSYGAHIEHYDFLNVSDPKYVMTQRNFINTKINDPPEEFTSFLILTSYDTFDRIILSNIPAFRFIVIPNDAENYLIMPYSYTDNLVGSFDVMDRDFYPRQQMNLRVGTAGQQFGYSSTYGNFSNSTCMDIILTAPFYTVNIDEGAVYVYKCSENSHMFDETPDVLHGEMEPFARFGISVANLNDINHDGFDDIVVLAAYWYKSLPQLFIYYSGGIGFTSTFYERIPLEEADGTDYTKVFAHLLYAAFDVNDDGVNDLTIAYPVENRVVYMTGILFTELKVQTGSSMLHNDVILLSTEGGTKADQSYYAINLTVCMSIKYLTDKILSQNIELAYRFKVVKRPSTFFYKNDMIHTQISGETAVTVVENEICECLTLLYQNYFIPGQESMEISVHVLAKGDESICHGNCIQPDPYTQNLHILPDILKCYTTECLPQFQLVVDMPQQPFEVGNINKRTIRMTLTNSGGVISYSPTAILMTTDKILVINPSVEGSSENLRKYETVEELTTELSRYYTYAQQLQPKEQITFTMDVEVIPYITQTLIKFQFKASDAMFTNSESAPIILEIPTLQVFGFLNGTSVPVDIIVVKVNSTMVTISEDLKYNLKVTNKLTAVPLDDVYIVIELPLSVMNMEIFGIRSVVTSETLTVTECHAELHSNCGTNVIVYHATSLPPISVTTLDITLRQTSSASVLIDNEIMEIELVSTIFYKSGEEQKNETTIVKTNVKSQAEVSNTTLIIAISVSVTVALILLAVLSWLAYKYKVLDKIKQAASK